MPHNPINSLKGESIGAVWEWSFSDTIREILYSLKRCLKIRADIKELNITKNYFSFFESINIGTERAFGFVWLNIKAFKKMFSGEINPTKNLAGPIGIAQIFGSQWNSIQFWSTVGLLSMILAFMNLLPIPALDGGHAMFLSYEIVSGKKPSEKFLEYSTRFGVIILLSLMSFVILNDIYKLFI